MGRVTDGRWGCPVTAVSGTAIFDFRDGIVEFKQHAHPAIAIYRKCRIFPDGDGHGSGPLSGDSVIYDPFDDAFLNEDRGVHNTNICIGIPDDLALVVVGGSVGIMAAGDQGLGGDSG